MPARQTAGGPARRMAGGEESMRKLIIILVLIFVSGLVDQAMAQTQELWRTSLLAYNDGQQVSTSEDPRFQIDTTEIDSVAAVTPRLRDGGQAKRIWIAEDSWFGRDKAEHFVRDFLIYTGLHYAGLKDKEALVATIGFNTAWEIKDIFFQGPKWGWWQGNGFDPKDWLYGLIGTGLAYYLFK